MHSQHVTVECKVYPPPLKPHFYIERQGFPGVCLFLLNLNIDYGYSLEMPRRQFQRVPTIYVLSINIKNIKKKKSVENFQFNNLRKLCVLDQILDLACIHLKVEYFNAFINHDPVMALAYLMTRST